MKFVITSQGRIRSLRALMTRVVDAIASLGIRHSGGGVVIVKIDAIGDFVLWLNSGRELRRIFPDQKLTLVANETWEQLARSLPYWDDVIPVKVKQFTNDMRYRSSVIRAVRRAGFDAAVQPTISRHFLTGDPLVRATGAKVRIGSAGDMSLMTVKEKRIADRWYTKLLPFSERGLTELELHAEFTSHLRGSLFPARLPELPHFREVQEYGEITRPYFIVFPGASWIGRQWPADRFASLITGVAAELGALPVLCGSGGEVDVCSSIASQCAHETLNLAGKTSLTQFAELVRHSALLIGNETSCIHIAAAVGTPSICILGGGHFGRFLPYPDFPENNNPKVVFYRMDCFGCNWACTQPHDSDGPMPCIKAVSVESVLTAVRALRIHPSSRPRHDGIAQRP